MTDRVAVCVDCQLVIPDDDLNMTGTVEHGPVYSCPACDGGVQEFTRYRPPLSS